MPKQILLQRNLTDDLEKNRSGLVTKIEEIKVSLEQRFSLIGTISTLISRVDTIESQLNSKLYEQNTHILALENQLTLMAKKEIASDMVLVGVPKLPNENLKSIFEDFCKTISCKPPLINQVFRAVKKESINVSNPHNKTMKESPSPIIIKLSSCFERDVVMKSSSNYRKMKNKELRLSDFGISSTQRDTSCYLNESLIKQYRLLLQSAIGLKRKQQLFSAYTNRGNVYI